METRLGESILSFVPLARSQPLMYVRRTYSSVKGVRSLGLYSNPCRSRGPKAAIEISVKACLSVSETFVARPPVTRD